MIIKDPIYRFIKVPELCENFINTFEFQRLRQIKQLGLVFYVYPSCCHTRFEHSLGVMHMAGRVIDILCNYVDITPREKDLVQLAGLLHDVGHVAFSHLIDYIMEENNLSSRHEDRSVWIMRRINARLNLLTPREEKMIEKMIKGDLSEEKKPFLFEVVNNQTFGLDVDRLDYIQRDLYHTGLPGFQPEYLIECIRIKNNRLALCRKGLSEMEMMYDARKRILLLVCRHTVVMKVEMLIRQVLNQLNIIENFWKDESWLTLTDATMQYLMDKNCR